MNRLVRYGISNCKERKRIFQYMKQCFIQQLPQIEQSVVLFRDPYHTVRVLNNLKKLNQVDEIAETCKETLKFMDITSENMNPQLIVDMAQASIGFLQPSDIALYDKIYGYVHEHKKIFRPDQLSKLEQVFYQVTRQISIGVPLEFHIDSNKEVSREYVLDKRHLHLRGINPHKQFQIMTYYQPDTDTNSVNIKFNKQEIILQGIHTHYVNDLVQAKSILSGTDKTVCINLPPQPTDPVGEKLDFLNQTQELLLNQETYGGSHRHLLTQKELQYSVQHFKKKYLTHDQNVMFTGNYLGFEVPFNLQSIMYYLSRNAVGEQILLTDLQPSERVDVLLENPMAGDLMPFLKSVWMTYLFEWSIEVTRQGCYNCNAQPTFLPDPADIIDELPQVKSERIRFIATMLRESLDKFGSQKIIVHQHLFWQILKLIVEEPIIKNKDKLTISEVRQLTKPKVSDNLELKEKFMQFYDEYIVYSYEGFETHQNSIHKSKKISNFKQLDPQQFTKEKWTNSKQIRCASRDILF